jgi:ATP synthase protein I
VPDYRIREQKMSNLKPPPVYKILVAQLVATILIAAILLFLLNLIAAYSMALGGLISVVANSYFTLLAFRYRGARNADKVIRSFRQGELGKIVITLLLFALAFTLIETINEAALIAGFLVAQFVGIIMSGMIDYSPVVSKS